jgi:hypothetical protein
MIERDSSLAAQAHFGLAALYRKAGSAAKAQHEMQEYQKLQGKSSKLRIHRSSGTILLIVVENSFEAW